MPNTIFTQLPNSFSFLRIFLAFITSYNIIYENKTYTLVCLLLAGISDFLDGYLARCLNCSSNFGEKLDPIADKIFIFFTFLSFLYIGKVSIYFFLMIILRDALILLGGYILIKKHPKIRLRPSFISKLNTTFIFIFFIFIATKYEFIIYYVMIFTTLFSGVDYVRKAIKLY